MFILELISVIGMIYLARKVDKIDKNTELYVRFEANPPPTNYKNEYNSGKSQTSSDSWVAASAKS